jgi:predicted PurR-regulated permease PerM
MMQLYEFVPSNDEGECWPLEKSAPAFDSRVRTVTQTVIATAVALLALWVAREFLMALTWATLIAVVL